MAVLDLDKNRFKNPDPDKNSRAKTLLILRLLIQKTIIPIENCALSASAIDYESGISVV